MFHGFRISFLLSAGCALVACSSGDAMLSSPSDDPADWVDMSVEHGNGGEPQWVVPSPGLPTM